MPFVGLAYDKLESKFDESCSDGRHSAHAGNEQPSEGIVRFVFRKIGIEPAIEIHDRHGRIDQ
jgi:hypothetical protein